MWGAVAPATVAVAVAVEVGLALRFDVKVLRSSLCELGEHHLSCFSSMLRVILGSCSYGLGNNDPAAAPRPYS